MTGSWSVRCLGRWIAGLTAFVEAVALVGVAPAAPAQSVPPLFHVQGRVVTGGAVFEGTGWFRFALVNGDGSETYWSNSADGNGDGQPDLPVALAVQRGLYTVSLGDTAIPNMQALAEGVFAHAAVHLRLWFDDGIHGVQRVTPDQRVTAAGYALLAATVVDGSVTAAKLAPGAVSAGSLAGVLSPGQLPPNVAYRDTDLLVASNALSAEVSLLRAQVQTLSNALVQVSALTNGGAATWPPGLTVSSVHPADPVLAAQGFVRFLGFPAPTWTDLPGTQSPAARFRHTAVWTGAEMVVWGGTLTPGVSSGSGAFYDPSLDAWSPILASDAPTARTGHSAVWTGSTMIIWGGGQGGIQANTGAAWQRSPQRWTALPNTGAPTGREGHVAVWTGSRMVIWGGRHAGGYLGDGAAWDPASGQWTPLPSEGAPTPRTGAVGVLVDHRVIVWGGEDAAGFQDSGARLLLDAQGVPTGWQGLPPGGPPARAGHVAVSTGQRLVVWGGRDAFGARGDGAILDPVAGTWEPMSLVGAPSARSDHRAVWTGSEMLVHGGEDAAGALASGAAFTPGPGGGTWRPLTGAGQPRARSRACAVWTGTRLLVFGGQADGAALASGQGLDPRPEWHLYRRP